MQMIEEKISGGKLVYIYFLDCKNSEKIGKIKICGDFFLHPEERIKRIEEVVSEQKIEIQEIELERIIEKELVGSEFAGFCAKDLARMIKRGRINEMASN